MRRRLLAPVLAVPAAALALPAAASQASLPVNVYADKDVSYEVLCNIKAQRTPDGAGFFNRYGINNKGDYADVIPSPNAECTMQKTGGKGPVTLRIVRFIKKPFTVTATTVGQKVQVQAW